MCKQGRNQPSFFFNKFLVLPECAKLSGSCAIAGLMGVVPSCHRAFVGIPCVLNVFSWVFREFDKLKRLITQFEYTKLTISYYGIIKIKWNKFLDFLKAVLVKKALMMQHKNICPVKWFTVTLNIIDIHWVKVSVFGVFWSVFPRIRAKYKDSRIQSECGKTRTRKTPNSNTFQAVISVNIKHQANEQLLC